MKKIIASSAIMALLLTNVQADFVFGDVFKELKHNENNKAYTNTDFVFGDIFKDLNKIVNTKTYAAKAPATDFVFGDLFKDLKTPLKS